MTELIVALDGPDPYDLLIRLFEEAEIRWFKIGPLTLASGEPDLFMDLANYLPAIKIFADFKWADTADTVKEATKRYADLSIAAVSTYTPVATMAAIEGRGGTPLQVWQIGHLTDSDSQVPPFGPIDGIIAPVSQIDHYRVTNKICPGIRLPEQSHDGHKHYATPQQAVAAGATHIVVGRPIWQADDPLAAAKQFLNALKGESQ